jgi:hypothetical protein
LVYTDDGVQRGTTITGSDTASAHLLDYVEWRSDAGALFASQDGWPAGEFLEAGVTATGGTQIADIANAITIGPNHYYCAQDLHWDSLTGYLYVGNGQVLDPDTGQTIATCGSGWNGMALDPAGGVGFYIDPTGAGRSDDSTWNPMVRSYDLSRFTQIQSTAIPVITVANTQGFSPSRILRCGPSMLAVAGGTSICLLTGPFAQGH